MLVMNLKIMLAVARVVCFHWSFGHCVWRLQSKRFATSQCDVASEYTQLLGFLLL